MVLAFKRIMIVTHNVQFAIDTKLALESLGDYAVTTITDARNAIETLRKQAHNLVLLDIENLEIPPPDLILAIHKIQKEIAIVLAPDTPDAHDIQSTADVQGVVDLPISIRRLIPILENSVRDIFDNLPETVKAPAIDISQETVYIETLVDELLENDETPYFTSRQIQAQKRSINPDSEDETTQQNQKTLEVIIESNSLGETVRYIQREEDKPVDRSLRLFQKLAEEEPPMPNIHESGTISDLARSVTQSNLLSTVEEEDSNEAETEARIIPPEDDNDNDDSDAIPAILVLQTAVDETTPIEAISLQTLYDNIQTRLPADKQSVRPLPSWIKEGEKFIREPVFLQDSLSYLENTQRPLEYTSTTTQPSDGTLVVSNSGDLETEVIESNMPFSNYNLVDDVDYDDEEDEPVAEAESDEPAPSVVNQIDEAQTESEGAPPAESIIGEVEAESEHLPLQAVIVPNIQTDDPYIAQLAVTLTQVTTELTAEATILTRDSVIVAYSGDMPVEDIDDLRTVIKDDWHATVDNARIRFITLPGNGKDYMLYSKGTVGGFTLSMVFAGTKQLRMIRRQGNRLLTALELTPDIEAHIEEVPVETAPSVKEETPDVAIAPLSPQEVMGFENDEAPVTPEEIDEPIDVGPKHPYTFIWLIDDYEIQLGDATAKKLVFWLEVQLNSLHWTIHKLVVHPDFIYLYADVPGDLSPSTLIRNLMERSQKIALSEDDSLPVELWADAYLVLTPGREMTEREIQRFLNFARDEG